MKKFIVLIAVLLGTATVSSAQNGFRAQVRNEETKEPVAGATVTVRETALTATTDADGRVFLENIPDGERIVEISSAGYATKELKLIFPLADQAETIVYIAVNNEVGEVTVSTTRTGREIDDTATRVEAIDEEEIDEKLNMRPANVSMVLNESTGIKVQQTSATTGTRTVRIQGLDGRYTQLLKDGFPAFGGFSTALSVLDIPPLDLRQVEIIKGPSATFYGGGAIAGVVNFISKEPEDEPVTTILFNQTSALGTDFSVFNSREFERFGYTLLGSANYQREYDADDNDFTELPRTKSFNLNPRFFFKLDERSNLIVGNTMTVQNRTGGDVFVIRDRADAAHQYFERNDSARNITTVQYDRDFGGGRKLVARQSLAFFNREIEIPNYFFKGRQFNSYTDVAYYQPVKNHALVFGFNQVYDRFRENANDSNSAERDETRTTFGGYAQDNFDLSEKLSVEAGLRLDFVKDYGAFALPRVSLLYKLTDDLSSRLSVGLGYKNPSIFTEQAETLLFQNVLPIGNRLAAERSRGGTFDVNYRSTVGENFSYNLNQMFFYTRITDPLVLLENPRGLYRFANAREPIVSSGFETNARFSYYFGKLFVGYTYTRAKAEFSPLEQLPLAPRSRINSALIFEKEANFKAGIEAYYTSSQLLSDGFRTRPFTEVGVFGEKTFGKISLFVNGENLTDVRQSRFGRVVFPPFQNPTFQEIYTHTEGRLFNGGIKIRL